MPERLTRKAGLAPASADREDRTVEVIWSTGAAVRRRDIIGEFIERLSLEPDAVDLSRLIGASVLDAHRQTAVRDVLGSVRKAAIDGQRGVLVGHERGVAAANQHQSSQRQDLITVVGPADQVPNRQRLPAP